MILLLLYVALDALRDSIAHHDAYAKLGKFFSRQQSEMNKPLFFKYFPMFWDAWHAAKFIQYNIVAFLLVKSLAFTVVTTIMSLLFILLYI